MPLRDGSETPEYARQRRARAPAVRSPITLGAVDQLQRVGRLFVGGGGYSLGVHDHGRPFASAAAFSSTSRCLSHESVAVSLDHYGNWIKETQKIAEDVSRVANARNDGESHRATESNET